MFMRVTINDKKVAELNTLLKDSAFTDCTLLSKFSK